MSTLKVGGIRGVSASSDAITVANDGTCTANVTSVNGGQIGNRRININGGFLVFQRSTSASDTGASEGYFAPDRYRQAGTGSMRYTASQSTDVPAGYGFSNSLKYDCTTASGTVSAGHFVAIEHRLEGQDVQVFCKGTAQAKQYTISFHVKSPKTGIHVVELYDNDNNRHVSKSYTISSADTWQKVTLTFPADTTGAFGNDNQASLRIFFWLMAGTDFAGSTLPSAWASFSSTARATGQVNVFDSTSNDFFITGIQLEVGSVATDFEHRSYAKELELCKRYFFMIGKDSKRNNNRMSFPMINEAPSNTGGYIDFRFYPEMRAAPTATIGSSLQLGLPQVGMSSHTVSSFNDMGAAGCHFFQYNNQTGSTGDSNKYLRAGFDDNSFAEFSAEL
jgi:hypothetical protein